MTIRRVSFTADVREHNGRPFVALSDEEYGSLLEAEEAEVLGRSLLAAARELRGERRVDPEIESEGGTYVDVRHVTSAELAARAAAAQLRALAHYGYVAIGEPQAAGRDQGALPWQCWLLPFGVGFPHPEHITPLAAGKGETEAAAIGACFAQHELALAGKASKAGAEVERFRRDGAPASLLHMFNR